MINIGYYTIIYKCNKKISFIGKEFITNSFCESIKGYRIIKSPLIDKKSISQCWSIKLTMLTIKEILL
jgi:hypothetical protein